MRQAIALAYTRMQESPAGDAWRATAALLDFVIPVALTGVCVVAMIYLVVGHLS
ncbi:MAG: hypothetical protein AB7P20_05580 [Rhizobiaceae bacterium]